MDLRLAIAGCVTCKVREGETGTCREASLGCWLVISETPEGGTGCFFAKNWYSLSPVVYAGSGKRRADRTGTDTPAGPGESSQTLRIGFCAIG